MLAIEPVDPLVGGLEGVLAEDGALRLVVQLQVDPVDGVVVASLLGGADEVAAQLGPRGLRGDRLGPEDRGIVGDPGRLAARLQDREDPPAPPDVVVGQIQLGDPRIGEDSCRAWPRTGRAAGA